MPHTTKQRALRSVHRALVAGYMLVYDSRAVREMESKLMVAVETAVTGLDMDVLSGLDKSEYSGWVAEMAAKADMLVEESRFELRVSYLGDLQNITLVSSPKMHPMGVCSICFRIDAMLIELSPNLSREQHKALYENVLSIMAKSEPDSRTRFRDIERCVLDALDLWIGVE